MTLAIELTPELERQLRQVAARNGMSSSDYARHLIEHHLPLSSEERQSLWEALPPEEWIRQTRAWVESHRDWPVLAPGADDRASFYDGRE